MTQGKGRTPARGMLVLAAAIIVASTAFAAYQVTLGRTTRAAAVVATLLAAAIVIVLKRRPETRWLSPAVAPLLAAAALGVLFFDRAALVPAVIGTVLMVLLAAGVNVEAFVAPLLAALTRGIAAMLGWIAFAVLILPAWAWSRIRRRDPMLDAAESPSTWTPTAPAPAGQATSLGGGRAEHSTRRSFAGRLTWGIGCVCVLLAANYGIGWAWNRAEVAMAQGPEVAEDEQSSIGEASRDPRIDHPAMADAPWSERYFADIQSMPNGYWPYTVSRPADFSSPYINQRDWIRESYQPDPVGERLPVAWMFGGSTAWGEGQRDEWTIASHLARISEAEGTPLQVMNHGQRSWTHFQEMILFEQRLNLTDQPDFAIFYDGANEITTQSLLSEPVPSHALVLEYAEKLAGSSIRTELVQPAKSDALGTDLWVTYRENSAVHKLVSLFRSPAVEAGPSQADPDPGKGIEDGQDSDSTGSAGNLDMTPQDGTDAGRIYERGKILTETVSARHGVEPFFFWQPVGFESEPQRRAIAELASSTIDISDILADRPDVFIDPGHTNEAGARIVAEELWTYVGPAVRAWYEENR